MEEDVPKRKEQTHFTVRLTEAKPVDKVKLIKEIKNYVQGINLVQVSPQGPLPGGLGTQSCCVTSPSHRQRSWWSLCPRKSKPTSPRPRRKRSRRPWRPWAAPWFWSRPALGLADRGPWDPGTAPLLAPTPRRPPRRPWSRTPRGGSALGLAHGPTEAGGAAAPVRARGRTLDRASKQRAPRWPLRKIHG